MHEECLVSVHCERIWVWICGKSNKSLLSSNLLCFVFDQSLWDLLCLYIFLLSVLKIILFFPPMVGVVSFFFIFYFLLSASSWFSWLSGLHHHHHHHVVLVARIPLTLSRHFFLSFIALGRSSGQHPVSSHSCWMYVRAGRPAFARPCVGVHKSTSLMSSSLLLQQCPGSSNLNSFRDRRQVVV